MPTFHYECRKDRGGCGHKFVARKAVISADRVICMGCGTTWQQTKKLADGSRVPIVERLLPQITRIPDPDGWKPSIEAVVPPAEVIPVPDVVEPIPPKTRPPDTSHERFIIRKGPNGA